MGAVASVLDHEALGPRPEHDAPHPALADQLADLVQGEERQQRNRHDGPHRQAPPPGAAADVRQALGDRMPADQAGHQVLGGMERHEHQREHRRLVGHGIDQRQVIEAAAELQLLGDQHDLGHDGGVDDGEALRGEDDVPLAQHQALVQHKQAEHHPQVDEHQQEPPELVDAAVLELSETGVGHGIEVVFLIRAYMSCSARKGELEANIRGLYHAQLGPFHGSIPVF